MIAFQSLKTIRWQIVWDAIAILKHISTQVFVVFASAVSF